MRVGGCEQASVVSLPVTLPGFRLRALGAIACVCPGHGFLAASSPRAEAAGAPRSAGPPPTPRPFLPCLLPAFPYLEDFLAFRSHFAGKAGEFMLTPTSKQLLTSERQDLRFRSPLPSSGGR